MQIVTFIFLDNFGKILLSLYDAVREIKAVCAVRCRSVSKEKRRKMMLMAFFSNVEGN